MSPSELRELFLLLMAGAALVPIVVVLPIYAAIRAKRNGYPKCMWMVIIASICPLGPIVSILSLWMTRKPVVPMQGMPPDELIRLLDSGNRDARRQAISILAARREVRASPALAKLVIHARNSSERCDAARALGELQTADGIESLIRALSSDKAAYVRSTAAEALGRIRDRRAAPALAASLAGDAEVSVRRAAALSLGALADPTYAPHLLRALSHDREARCQAATALGWMAHPSVVPALLSILLDPHVRLEDPVRDRVCYAVARIYQTKRALLNDDSISQIELLRLKDVATTEERIQIGRKWVESGQLYDSAKDEYRPDFGLEEVYETIFVTLNLNYYLEKIENEKSDTGSGA